MQEASITSVLQIKTFLRSLRTCTVTDKGGHDEPVVMNGNWIESQVHGYLEIYTLEPSGMEKKHQKNTC